MSDGLGLMSELIKRLREAGWDDDEILQHRDYQELKNRLWGADK